MKPKMTPAEAEAYCRSHVAQGAGAVATSVVADLLDELDRTRVRLREMENLLAAELPEPEPQPTHLPMRGRDACLVPGCKCPARQAATT